MAIIGVAANVLLFLAVLTTVQRSQVNGECMSSAGTECHVLLGEGFRY